MPLPPDSERVGLEEPRHEEAACFARTPFACAGLPRLSPNDAPASLVAQSDYGIDLDGAARRDVAGQSRHADQ